MAQRGDGDAEVAPSEIFDVLGNETRLAIVQELARHRRTAWRREGLGFADLRKAVGERDAGTFNYHLDALQDRFVETDGDEYVLRTAGLEVADAMLAGQYGADDVRRRHETEYDCPDCSEALAATFEGELFALRCPDHGVVLATSLPSGVASDRSGEELVDLAVLDLTQEMERAREGLCFHCWGRMHPELQRSPPLSHPATGDPVDARVDPEDAAPLAVFGCERCETVFWTSPASAPITHPAVIGFALDHGFDARTGLYPMGAAAATATVSTSDRDDAAVTVTYEHGGDVLTVRMDDALTVVDVERAENDE